MTDRAAAVRSLRHARTNGIPPPTALVSDDEGAENAAPVGDDQPPFAALDQLPDNVDVDPGTTVPTELENLLRDPVAACRAMSQYREDMPARALNVDLTPATARHFDEQCRALRIKKKDVIELLLRGWLVHLGHQDLDTPTLSKQPHV